MAWPGPLLLKDRKGRAYLVFPKEGGVFHHHKGSVPHEALLEAGPGGGADPPGGGAFRPPPDPGGVPPPHEAERHPHLPQGRERHGDPPGPRPGDAGPRAGTGSGGLTLFLARAVGEKGLVESYEARPHHLAQAERNVRAFWQVENVRFHLGKLEEAELEEAAYDGVALDLMEPWKALEKAALALKPDRFLVAYLPNITQVLELVRAAEAHPFRLERVLEVGWREWEVRLPVAHPRFQQVGHTAFLVALRRWKAS